jgi:hypothetical protein
MIASAVTESLKKRDSQVTESLRLSLVCDTVFACERGGTRAGLMRYKRMYRGSLSEIM